MRITENMKIPQRRQLIYIIVAPLVNWLRKQDFPMAQPPIRFYPDGSLWTDDYEVLRWTHESVIGGRKHRERQGVEQLIHHHLPGAYTSVSFRPLVAFGGDDDVAPQYNLLYPGSCYAWMGEHERGALMYPVTYYYKGFSEEQYDLAHVRVLIRLRRKFTSALAEELGGVLRQWFSEIGSVGVFGEAGLKSISPALLWLDKCAGFELDARGSGQETLNTLYLAVLNWGMNQKRPLVLTDLAADKCEPVFASDQSIPLT
jgi:hypothetical protein